MSGLRDNSKLRIEKPCLDADGNGHGVTNDPERPCPNFNCSGFGYTTPEATTADLIAVVRREVESGEIEGQEVEVTGDEIETDPVWLEQGHWLCLRIDRKSL